MKLSEYATYDAMGLADLINSDEVSAPEVRDCALRAIDAVNDDINAVIETYDDPVPAPSDTPSDAPFAGVPYLIKDVGAHFGGLKCEFCSRLCEGMIAAEDSHYAGLVRRSGVSIVGRTNTPEFSMSGTSENTLYGNTSTPWKQGYSSNGSSGGSAAAVSAGIVPMAHGSDIGGSIRGPAAWCGSVGLKPSRARVSSGPNYDEWGHGMSMSFVRTKTIRDTATMLDHLAVPQPGDPFVIARAPNPYTSYLDGPARPLKLAFSAAPLMDAPVDPEVAEAVRATAKTLEDMGHHVTEDAPPLTSRPSTTPASPYGSRTFMAAWTAMARRWDARLIPIRSRPEPCGSMSLPSRCRTPTFSMPWPRSIPFSTRPVSFLPITMPGLHRPWLKSPLHTASTAWTSTCRPANSSGTSSGRPSSWCFTTSQASRRSPCPWPCTPTGAVRLKRTGIIERRNRIKKLTIQNRRLNHQRQAA